VLAITLMALSIATTACKRPKKTPVLESVVVMNDAAAEGQLTRGFYGIEGNSWRWTARSFAVTLQPPPGSEKTGARLHLKFALPDAVIDKVGPVEVMAYAGGKALAAERYTTAGNHDYMPEIPAAALAGGPVEIEFVCDKALESVERRQLALIAVSVGLEPR
jgi:hypothetical protein